MNFGFRNKTKDEVLAHTITGFWNFEMDIDWTYKITYNACDNRHKSFITDVSNVHTM